MVICVFLVALIGWPECMWGPVATSPAAAFSFRDRCSLVYAVPPSERLFHFNDYICKLFPQPFSRQMPLDPAVILACEPLVLLSCTFWLFINLLVPEVQLHKELVIVYTNCCISLTLDHFLVCNFSRVN